MDKYRPETKQAKKERLRERAAARFVPLSTTFNWMMGAPWLDRAVRPSCLSARALGNIKLLSGRFTPPLDRLGYLKLAVHLIYDLLHKC